MGPKRKSTKTEVSQSVAEGAAAAEGLAADLDEAPAPVEDAATPEAHVPAKSTTVAEGMPDCQALPEVNETLIDEETQDASALVPITCCRCNQPVDSADMVFRPKRQSQVCNICNAKSAALYREFGSWPPPSFMHSRWVNSRNSIGK